MLLNARSAAQGHVTSGGKPDVVWAIQKMLVSEHGRSVSLVGAVLRRPPLSPGFDRRPDYRQLRTRGSARLPSASVGRSCGFTRIAALPAPRGKTSGRSSMSFIRHRTNRLARSLQDLVGFLSEIHAAGGMNSRRCATNRMKQAARYA
jgi:hypothetical protein